MFIENFQDTSERPSIAETLKTIKQKHDESLQNYVKHFCNARNTISYIQDIEIINAFHDGVSDINTVEEIAMKKPKTVDDLLAVADVCIEASETWAQLLESRGKEPLKKKQDNWEVNITDRRDYEDHGDRGYHGNRQQQSSDQKEKRLFHRPADVEKWCEIHRTAEHDMKECKTFLNRKKMPRSAAPVSQERYRGEHHRADPNNEDQMGKISVIFGGSMSITLKTQGKMLKWEISLAQRIKHGRKMKWSDMDILFVPEDHPEMELSERNLSFVIKLLIG
jgi:hypothetical protein